MQDEYRAYGDIVLADFVDTYSNLTLKTLSMLKWINTYCDDADYFLKADDDVFVNIPLLVHELRNLTDHVTDHVTDNVTDHVRSAAPLWIVGNNYIIMTALFKPLHDVYIRYNFSTYDSERKL